MRSLMDNVRDSICFRWRLDHKSVTVIISLVGITVLSLATFAFYTLDQDIPTLKSLYNAIAAEHPTNLTRPNDKITFFSGEPPCDRFPHPDNLVVSVKTGATEALSRLPTQLITNLRCVHKPLIFSDVEQRLGDHQIYDVLDHFSPEAMKDNPDFDIYRLQQSLVADGREDELPLLKDVPMPHDDWRTQGHSAAWGLDKYKFLHMVEHAWTLAPNKDWYLFIEADTYLVWPNFLRWILTLNPQEKRYYGYPIRMWEHPTELYFAYGGAGFLLSGAAVKEFVVEKEGLANRWDDRISKMWFGDYVMAAALEAELGLTITKAWPSMNPDEPTIVHFGLETWCQPVFTLHHVDALHSDKLWEFEQQHDFEHPLLFRDLYKGTYPEGLPSKRTDWDNLAGDDQVRITKEPEKLSGTSSDNTRSPETSEQACEDACVHEERCLQYMFVKSVGKGNDLEWKTECHLSNVLRIGHQRSPHENDKGRVRSWTSVWMSDRIAKWIDDHQDCPTDTSSWPH